MRKLIMDFIPGKIIFALGRKLFDTIDRFELYEVIRRDHTEAEEVTLGEVTLKEGVTWEDVKWPSFMNMALLHGEHPRYVIITRKKAPTSALRKLYQQAQADVVFTSPTIYEKGLMTLSCIGEEEELNKTIKGLGRFGTVENIRYHKAVYQEHNMLSVLTSKQREVLIAAKRMGYYEYPRKVNADDLARDMDISKATVVEHLRKAEIRLMEQLLAGY